MLYKAAETRYDEMKYNRCGKSGLKLPAISLGLWHNFGAVDVFEKGREVILRSFDLGITHFDIANNYGPPPGYAEETFGRVFAKDLHCYRDEIIISTKAAGYAWPGPYGEWGSRKTLLGSLDKSLKRIGVDYVDIFYSHRPDPDTPLEETMSALDQAVRSGKALYAGISNYPADMAEQAAKILKSLGTPCLIHQPIYNILVRGIEDQLIGVLKSEGVGCIVYCPLAQGLLTDKYLDGIPEGSRASKSHGALKADNISEDALGKVQKLNEIAKKRGQSLAQMALCWVLRDSVITSALVGASSVAQIEDNVAALQKSGFSQEELDLIDKIAG